jgi:predicted nucleotidyltransferase
MARARQNSVLDELLTSSTRARLLTILLAHPSQEYYLRELHRRSGRSLRAVQHELARLERLGLVVTHRRGREKFYRANDKHPLFADLKGIVDKTAQLIRPGKFMTVGTPNPDKMRERGSSMTVEEKLREKRGEILRIAAKYGARNVRVFGSIARKEADEQSDIDFLVEMDPGRSLLDLGGLQYELESLLGSRVDVATVRGLKARIRDRILHEAVPV